MATINRLTESLSVAPQLQPEDMAELARAGFKTVINNRPDGESEDQPSSTELAAAAEVYERIAQRASEAPSVRREAAWLSAELAEQTDLPMILEPELREMHFGDWEGLPHAEAQRLDPQAWQQFWQSPDQASPPNGEAMPDFCRRVTGAIDGLVEQYQGESLLVVAHGAVNRVVICHWLGMPMGAMTRLSVPYAGLSRFKIYHQAGQAPWYQLDSHF